MQFAVQAADLGIWDIQPAGARTILWNDRCRELFGLAAGAPVPYIEALQAVHEDDRAAV